MVYKGLVNFDVDNKPDLDSLALNRIPYVEHLVKDFISFYQAKYGIALSTIPDIAAKISYLYFSLCYEHIKPVIDDRTNRYKMASLMELLIVQNQVFIHPDTNEEKQREVNAVFAMNAGFSMINCMATDAKQELVSNTLNARVDERVKRFLTIILSG